MEVHQIVLAYLEVLLSWPPLVGLLGTVVLVLFKKEVRSLIGRIARIRFPGGGEIALPRQAPPTDTKDAPEVPEGDVKLPPNVSGAEADRLREAIRSERAATYLWEYRYLNRYLVLATQLVLDHIASSAGPIALRLLDSYLHAFIPSANERNAILDALAGHHLVLMGGDGLIEVTPKGREYIAWRGPLPDQAPNSLVGAADTSTSTLGTGPSLTDESLKAIGKSIMEMAPAAPETDEGKES